MFGLNLNSIEFEMFLNHISQEQIEELFQLMQKVYGKKKIDN